MKHDADWARQAQRELRGLLNEWDPIGVFDPDDEAGSGPVDEYDCIRDPLISRLLKGDGRYEIAEYLRGELNGHFGLESRLVTANLINGSVRNFV